LPATKDLDPRTPEAVSGGGSNLLAELATGLAADDDMREPLARLLPAIAQVAGAQAAVVRMLDTAGQRLLLAGEFGLPQSLREAESAVGHDCGACGALLAAHATAGPGRPAPCAGRSEQAFADAGMPHMLVVPLARRGRLLGAFNLFFDARHEPSADLRRLLDSIGDLLALALDNVRLESENLRAALASERQAIAAEVHDSIGQSLAYVKMRLPLLEDAIRDSDRNRAEGYFDDVRSAIRQAHGSLRAVLAHMRAPMDPLGLGHALAAAAETFRQQGATAFEVADHWAGVRLEPEQEAQVFHIVQEALSNVSRHAGAGHAWLRLERDAGFLAVTIADDGRGPPPAGADAGSSHYGLTIMRERARRLGGTLDIGARAGGGTAVCLRFPAKAAAGQRMSLPLRANEARRDILTADPH
jgi:two-component system, NarL family, nitrate/nitrite sensor histidine kinase NarX